MQGEGPWGCKTVASGPMGCAQAQTGARMPHLFGLFQSLLIEALQQALLIKALQQGLYVLVAAH